MKIKQNRLSKSQVISVRSFYKYMFKTDKITPSAFRKFIKMLQAFDLIDRISITKS